MKIQQPVAPINYVTFLYSSQSFLSFGFTAEICIAYNIEESGLRRSWPAVSFDHPAAMTFQHNSRPSLRLLAEVQLQ